MCIVVVLAVLILPVLGGVVGYGVGGVGGAWLGAGGALVVAVGLIGVPTGIFMAIEKKKYDRQEREDPYA